MAQRLVEIYRIGDAVEVCFQGDEGDDWRSARIMAQQHPGIWAMTADRRLWFVTNGKRIRPAPPSPRPEPETGESQAAG